MVRVRKRDGSTQDIPDSEAVEILGDDNKLALVIIQDRRGTTRVAVPGDPLFNAYIKTTSQKPAAVHQHPVMPVADPADLA